MRIIFRISLFFGILLIGIAGFAIYLTFYKPLPDHNAEISLDGLDQPADVHWDPYGVPHIYAGSEDDLFFTIGYLHAQDRLWQMTLSQLMAEGRFAEFLGEQLADLDRHQRTIGIWRTSQQIYEESPDSLIHILEKYSDGVNEYIRQHQDELPIEMTLLDIDPIEWTPTHSIAVSRLMAWDLNIHWWSEMTFAYLGTQMNQSRLQQLIPFYENSYPTSLNEEETSRLTSSALQFLDDELDARSLLQKRGSMVGSNAWAVSGNKTSSGAPILAGDPHLGLSIPGYWYEIHAWSPEFNIAGASIPGAPFVVLGQNKQISWSITNTMADDTDFFIEQPHPDNPDIYVADSADGDAVVDEYEWQQEIISVKGKDDQFIRIPHTRHGPVINQIHPGIKNEPARPVTMRWTGHDVSHELWAFYKLNKAEGITEFRQALTHFGVPAMNFIYADRSDNIALFSAGQLPVRDYHPLMFRYGWDSSYDWNGRIPLDEMPRVVNPQKGYVANANNKLHTENYPHYIGSFWAPPSRISRIESLLEQTEEIDTDYMQEMQRDIYSGHAAEILEIVLPLLRSAERDNEFGRVLPYLENWDHNYSINSTAASLFDLFFMNLSEQILQREIPPDVYDNLVRMELIPVLMVTNILSDDTSFFNIVTEENIEMRNEIMRTSMLNTIDQLTNQLGAEPFEWRWENLHTLTLKPPLLGDAAGRPDSSRSFSLIVNNLLSKGPYPVPGHGMTINKGEYSWNDPFSVILGPSIRRIIDMGSPSRSLSVLPTGQSGQPLSAHYGDQTELWLDNGYRFIYSDSTFFQQSNYETMKMEPLSIH